MFQKYTLNFHLFSYDVATGTGSTAGDLSNGAVVASSGSTLTIGNDRVTTTTLTIDSTNTYFEPPGYNTQVLDPDGNAIGTEALNNI